MTEESKIVEAKKRRKGQNIERNNLCKNCKKIILNCFDYFICHERCEDTVVQTVNATKVSLQATKRVRTQGPVSPKLRVNTRATKDHIR